MVLDVNKIVNSLKNMVFSSHAITVYCAYIITELFIICLPIAGYGTNMVQYHEKLCTQFEHLATLLKDKQQFSPDET